MRFHFESDGGDGAILYVNGVPYFLLSLDEFNALTLAVEAFDGY